MEKAVHLWVEDMNKKVLIDSTVLCQKMLSLCKDLSQGYPGTGDSKQVRVVHRFKNRVGMLSLMSSQEEER